MNGNLNGGSISGKIDITGTLNGTITIGGGSTPILQEKTVSPRKTQRIVEPDSGYDGLSKVTVRGAYLQDKTVNSSESSQYITADEDYLALNSVTINPYSLQLKTVYPSTSQQLIEADSGYDGLKSVTVEPVSLQSIQVTPASTQQVITPDSGYDGIGQVTVDAITLQSKTVTPSSVQQTVTPDSGYNGLSRVTVGAVEDKFNFLMNNDRYSSRPTFEVNQDGTGLEGFTYGYNILVHSSGRYNCPVSKAFYYQKYLKNIVADGWESMENGEELAYSGIVTGHFASVMDFVNSTFKGCTDITDLYFGYDGVISGMLMSGRIFNGKSSGTVNIHVPAGQLSAYQADSTWQGIVSAEAAAGVTVNILGDYV